VTLKCNPHALGFSKVRFWSSGDTLSIRRVIARVLADPTEDDILILKRHFGMDEILATWGAMIMHDDVAKVVIPITNDILTKLNEDNDKTSD